MPQSLSVVFLALALLPSGEDSTAPLAAPLAVYGEISMGAEEATLDLEAEIETTWRLVLTALEVDQLALPDEVLADTWLVIDDLWLRLEVLPWKSGVWTRVRLRAGTMERTEDVVRARELLEGVIRGLEALRQEQAREQEAQRAMEQLAQRLAAGRPALSDFRVPAVWVLPTWIPFHTMLWADAWVWSHGVWDASQTVIHHTVGWWGDPWCFDDDDYDDYDDGWDDLASADDDDLPTPGGNGGADDDGTGGSGDDDVIDHVPPLNPRIAHWDGGRLPARPGPTGADVSVSARGGPGSSGKGGSKGSGGKTFGGGVASGGSTGTSGSGSKGSRSIVLPALPLGALRPSRGTITTSGFGMTNDVRFLPRVTGSSGRTSGGSGGSTTVASGGSGSTGSTGSTFGSSSGSNSGSGSGSSSGSSFGSGSSSGSSSGSNSGLGSFGSSRSSPSLGRTTSISTRPSSTTTSGRSSFGTVSLPGRGSLSLPKSNTSSRSAPARASAPKSSTSKANSSGKSSGSKSGGKSSGKSSGSKSGGKSKSKSSKGRP
jgi:hypothetical protein